MAGLSDDRIRPLDNAEPAGLRRRRWEFVSLCGQYPDDAGGSVGLTGVGHHWVSVSVLTDPEIRKRLTDAAFEVGMGAYSGKTYPDHHFGT